MLHHMTAAVDFKKAWSLVGMQGILRDILCFGELAFYLRILWYPI